MMISLLAAVLVAGAPDVVLRGTLTGEDNQTWRSIAFEVPAGTIRITVDFEYTARDEHTTIDLGVLGPDGFRGVDGFRGWSGGNKHSFTISATDATPSYLAGPLQPGTWSLLLGIPNIRSATRAEYTANIRFAGYSDPALRTGPGWYRGDLHMHTAHSDGSCPSRREKQRVPCPLFLTAKAASERGLDFIAITDHNTTSQANDIRELQPYFDDLLMIPGREITTFHGHANLFGTVAPIDFRVGSPEVPDWIALLAQIEHSGGAISINHPVRPSGEQCMGCGWTPPEDVDYGRFQAIEVVNGQDADTPFSGIPFWEHLLDRGYKLTALGGSDNHDPQQNDSGGIGTPTTVIYAEELSEGALIAAIRRGRVFIDVAGTRDRAIDVTARADGHMAYMGETLQLQRGARVRFTGSVSNVPGGAVEVVIDGRRASVVRNSYINSGSYSFEFTWRADGERHWLRVAARDGSGHLALVGNPIYVAAPAVRPSQPDGSYRGDRTHPLRGARRAGLMPRPARIALGRVSSFRGRWRYTLRYLLCGCAYGAQFPAQHPGSRGRQPCTWPADSAGAPCCRRCEPVRRAWTQPAYAAWIGSSGTVWVGSYGSA